MQHTARHHHRAKVDQPHAAAACLAGPLDTGTPGAAHPRRSVRVLVIPGLRDSGPAHWQTWLQGQCAGAVRVNQDDWHRPDLADWSKRIGDTLEHHGGQTLWVAAAHSFGCLALAHHLAQDSARRFAEPATSDAGLTTRGRIVAALMVAPADPLKFGLTDALPRTMLGAPLTVIGSEDDPWMPLARARAWAHAWGGGFINLGHAGHINTESGFGPWPFARHKVEHLVRQQQRTHTRLCRVDCETP